MPEIGPYELLGELGRGGMGVVYRARAPQGHEVALKVLNNTLEEKDVMRFEGEGAVLRALRHPHVVTLHGLGWSRGRPYLAMDLVEGTSLAARLRRGPLSSAEVLVIGVGLASALAHAHDHGVLHRDLKPGNILLRPDGHPVLTDFGIAKYDGLRSITLTGELLGTPSYMAPEQARGEKDLTPAADIFSLGATLYEALTSVRPFRGASPLATLSAIQVETPLPPSTCVPGIPEGLDALVLRCLSKAAADRPSALEVREACVRLGGGGETRQGGLRLLGGSLVGVAVLLAAWATSRPVPVESPSPGSPPPTRAQSTPAGSPAARASPASPMSPAELDAALKRSPAEPALLEARLALTERDDWQRRERLLGALVKARPLEAGLHLDHAEVLLSAERYPRCQAAITSAIKCASPHSGRAERLSLELDLRQGLFTKALARVDDLRGSARDDLSLVLARARALTGLGRYEGAESMFDLLRTQSYPQPWRGDYARLLRWRDREEAGRKVIEKGLASHPKDLRLRLESLALLDPRRSRKEMPAQSRALRRDFGPRPSVLAEVAFGHVATGALDQARETLEAALAVDPNQARALLLRVFIVPGVLRPPRANALLADLARTASLEPGNRMEHLSYLLQWLGQGREVLAALEGMPERQRVLVARFTAHRILCDQVSGAEERRHARLAFEIAGKSGAIRPGFGSALVQAEAQALLGHWDAARVLARPFAARRPPPPLILWLSAQRILERRRPDALGVLLAPPLELPIDLAAEARDPWYALRAAKQAIRRASPDSPEYARGLALAMRAAVATGRLPLARGWDVLLTHASGRDRLPREEAEATRIARLRLGHRPPAPASPRGEALASIRRLRIEHRREEAVQLAESMDPRPENLDVWVEYLRTVAVSESRPLQLRVWRLAADAARPAKARGPERGALACLQGALVSTAGGKRNFEPANEQAQRALKDTPHEPYALATMAGVILTEASYRDPRMRIYELDTAIRCFTLALAQEPLLFWRRLRALAFLEMLRLPPHVVNQPEALVWLTHAERDHLQALGGLPRRYRLWLELADFRLFRATLTADPAQVKPLAEQALDALRCMDALAGPSTRPLQGLLARFDVHLLLRDKSAAREVLGRIAGLGMGSRGAKHVKRLEGRLEALGDE